jgi:purine nucleosidase
VPPRPLIIDSDPGKDDAVAILLALAAPETFDVLMISAAAGNVGLAHTSANSRRLCELAGRSDLPVHPGCPRPILQPLRTVADIHGADGLSGAGLPPPSMRLSDQHAVPALIEAITTSPEPCHVACLAPVTNLAVALVMAPEISHRIGSIVFMGGSFTTGNITPYASFNVYTDPHAARIVFECGAPVTMIGLDVTRRTMPSPEWLQELRTCGTPQGRVIADLWGEPTAFMNDACVIAYMLEPELFKVKRCRVAVEIQDEVEMGRTRVVEDGAAEIQVATDIDVEGFFDLLYNRLARPRRTRGDGGHACSPA